MKSTHRPPMRHIIIGVILFFIALGCTLYLLTLLLGKKGTEPAQMQQSTTVKNESTLAKPPQVPSFDKSRLSHTDPSSLWVVVNKAHAISPQNYVPTDIITGVQGYAYSQRIDSDLQAMLQAAASDGVTLSLSSAYRSYDNQAILYRNYIAQYGQVPADTISARAGHSEHQTGLAVDIGGATNPGCNFNECFGETIEGQWLAARSSEFGFMIRYTKENGALTGYNPEPWHLRYVGRELTTELQKQQIATLEELFDVSGGTTYSD